MSEDFADKADGLVRVVQDHFSDEAARILSEPFPQPVAGDFPEYEIRLLGIHQGRAGIDVRFGRIGPDEPLAEAVDGRTGQFVNGRTGRREVASTVPGKPFRQRYSKFVRDAAGRQFVNERAHARQKLACGKFGECHRCDRLRRNAGGEHQRNAAGHDGGLAGTSTSLYQKRAIMNRDGGAPGLVVGERLWQRKHHGASQTSAAAPSRADAAAILRLQ
jgi:hypothetical protein